MNTKSRRAAMKLAGGMIAAPLLGKAVRAVEEKDRKRQPRIKVGQIGVGHAHASKLSVYRRSDDFEVVGIVEPDACLRERASRRRPIVA